MDIGVFQGEMRVLGMLGIRENPERRMDFLGIMNLLLSLVHHCILHKFDVKFCPFSISL